MRPAKKKIKKNWDRCYDFKNIFAKKLAKQLAVLLKTTAVVLPKMDPNNDV
jgi:hypothetical protein